MSSVTRPKILLTGVTGQLGWELFQSLQCMGDVVPSAAPGESFHAPCLRLDLADPDQVRKTMDEVRPNIVINPAAYTAVDAAEDHIELADTINGTAPGVLAEICKNLECPMVHYSTDYVYGNSTDDFISEDEPTNPINAYGRSKLKGDQAIADVGGSHIILRTSWVYGLVGKNFVKTMLGLAQKNKELKIVADQFGAPTSARTLSDMTCNIVAQNLDHTYGRLKEKSGVYHAVNQGVTSWHGFAELIFELARDLELKSVVETVQAVGSAEFPTKARRPKNSRLSCQKLEHVFGLRPEPWQQALKNMMTVLGQALK